jgi:hypothetical protein
MRLVLANVGTVISWIASAAAIVLLAWAAYIIYVNYDNHDQQIGLAAIWLTAGAVVWLFGQCVTYVLRLPNEGGRVAP